MALPRTVHWRPRALIAALALSSMAACSGSTTMPELRVLDSAATQQRRVDAGARVDAISALLTARHVVVGQRRLDTCRYNARRWIEGFPARLVCTLRTDLAIALRGDDGRAALTDATALLRALSCRESTPFMADAAMAPGEGAAGGAGNGIGAARFALCSGNTAVDVETFHIDRIDSRQVSSAEQALPGYRILREDPPISIAALRAAAPLGTRYLLMGTLSNTYLEAESPE